ncbi:MAG: hypothetical protein OHK0029_13080 [Armatimonadaceae bacterium]
MDNLKRIIFQKSLLWSGAVVGASALLASPGWAQATKKAKPAAKPPVKAAPKPAPAKPAANRPVVLGTQQLPGDFGKFGTTYTIGTREPVNFTLNRAEYSVTPLSFDNNTYVPKADQKLLVLHYTIHNPNPQELSFDWSALRFTAVDSQDTNHDYIQAVAREGQNQPLSIRLKPAQKLEVYSAILVPAEGVVPKLIVQRERTAPVIRYDLREKVAALPEPIADTADPTGATARKDVPAVAATWYALGAFDARLEKVEYVAGPLVRREAGKGNRFVTTTFTIRNRTARRERYYWSDFLGEVRDADGEKIPYTQAILKVTRDEAAQGELEPGEEIRIRFFFPVPEGVAAKTLRLSEGRIIDVRQARAFLFDLSQVQQTAATAP